jgi:hypothetical protein
MGGGMSAAVQCVITGCFLFAPNEQRVAYGDLHQIGGEAYVFNAVLEEGETMWRDGFPPPSTRAEDSARVVSVDSNNYFERRGVIVFPEYAAVLNDAAREHIARGRRH